MSSPKLPAALAPDLLNRVRTRFEHWPVTEGLDLAVEDLEPGRARIRLPLSLRVQNGPRGNMNGGWLANLADMACAFALCTAFDGLMPFATSDLHYRYLEPAYDAVAVEAMLVRLSKSTAVIECRLTSGEALIGFATANFAIKPNLRG
ncbi:MAG TPA: PaaI family thioesterase [Holophagaceae bacterium]|nr:PaaI family thioesterase [Holophagaceae bacterium]